jgi:hypothetical protein
MNWMADYTDRIRALIDDNSEASLTYAALEARLAIERICYERLRLAHNYISADDLRSWKPQYVVQTLMEMVDSKIASEWTLSIGSEPGDNPKEYLEVGVQKGFDPKKLSRLWQTMGSFLHNRVPKNQHELISHYSDAEKILPKLNEVLLELDRIGQGTMMTAMVFEQISFECSCGQTNKRAKPGLSDGMTVNCIRESCKEQFIVEETDNEFYFTRKSLPVTCRECGHENQLPNRQLIELPKEAHGAFDCAKCGVKNLIKWKLMQLASQAERGDG